MSANLSTGFVDTLSSCLIHRLKSSNNRSLALTVAIGGNVDLGALDDIINQSVKSRVAVVDKCPLLDRDY
jgi:hypothetical protein